MRYLRLAVFVVLVVGVGFAIGLLNRPGGWYAALAKPAFNPPNWVFAPVWSIIYLLVSVAGWRTWERNGGGWAMTLWWNQMALNWLWSPIFFTAHSPGAALAVILLLLAAVLAFVAKQWSLDRISAWLCPLCRVGRLCVLAQLRNRSPELGLCRPKRGSARRLGLECGAVAAHRFQRSSQPGLDGADRHAKAL